MSDNPIETKRRVPLLLKLLILILSVPAFILLTELIFTIVPVNTYFENRFFLVNRSLDYPEVFKKDHELFWRFRPDQTITSRFFDGKTYHINSLGLRGSEIAPKSDKLRIVILGNSCTFGWGMPDGSPYAEVLERMINGDSTLPKVEIINAGIPGYSSFQGKNFFMSDILKLQPDIVIVTFAWNDHWAAADNIPDDEQKLPPQWALDIQNFFSRLKIYQLSKKLILSATEESLNDKLDKKNPVYRVSFEDFYNNLNMIVNYARSNGIRPILLTSPIPALNKYYPPESSSMMHRYHERYNEQTRRLASDSKTELIDIAREFDNYDSLYDDAPKDPIHFNAAGHRVVAEMIYNHMKSNLK